MLCRKPKPLLLAALVSASSRQPRAAAQETNIQNASAVFDHLTAWKECSLGPKEWSICLQPTGWGPLWYCPTVDETVNPVVDGASAALEDIYWYGIQTNFLPCFSCPEEGSPHGHDCESAVATLVGLHNITEDTNPYYDVPADGLRMCIDLCESGRDGDPCSSDGQGCTAGSHFCDLAANRDGGTCRGCPADIEDCGGDGFPGMSELAQRECRKCRLGCYDVGISSLVVDGEELESSPIGLALQEPELSAFGPLVDCSDLVFSDVNACRNSEGSVCLIEDSTLDAFFHVLSDKAEKIGCVALVMFGNSTHVSGGVHFHDHLAIPFVEVGSDVGEYLRENKLETIAHVGSKTLGSSCYPSWDVASCSDVMPCLDSIVSWGQGDVDGKDTYCDFTAVVREGEYVEGLCEACPIGPAGEPDPAGCFFTREGQSGAFMPKHQKAVESCAKSCNAGLSFGECKFCPSDISAFEFGVENKADQCEFCPQDDVLYPKRFVPLLGENVTCYNMQAFFDRLEVHKDSGNCLLAQSFNYICGCEGPGYMGASTHAKKNALVWLPRVSAILSALGSIFLLVDVLRVKTNRNKLFYQLMVQMSLFDLVGSVAYAFTSLPIPEEWYIHGSRGTDATCTAQGFFIQVGTVAAYTNVSLAFYFLLKVRNGWSEMRLRKVSTWFFACPVVVGMTFAFAGIPFMDNMILWCNNAEAWWPDIPVAIAIFVATIVMGLLCWDVHKTVQASKRWRQGGEGGNTLSTQVFWQSFWYLMAFYMTWPPYLALQYLWASKKAYTNYNFILYAGTVVPLQGVWNWFVYARNRQLKGVRQILSSLPSRISRRLSGSLQDKDPVTTQNSTQGNLTQST